MFFTGFYMIQLNRDEEPYFFASTKENSLQCLLRMYYMVLGDFGSIALIRSFDEDNDNYDAALVTFENALSVFFFIGVTLITQITILNMLIAIMSVTHGEHVEMHSTNSQKQRLLLETEFAAQNNIYVSMNKGYARPIVWLCNCFNSPRVTPDLSYNYLQVITMRTDIEDGDDERSGGQDSSSGGLNKALDDKFK